MSHRARDVIERYAQQNRYIPRKLYVAIKRRTKCKICGKYRGKKLLEAHHKLPVRLGGKSIHTNVIGCHHKCHIEEDKKIAEIEQKCLEAQRRGDVVECKCGNFLRSVKERFNNKCKQCMDR